VMAEAGGPRADWGDVLMLGASHIREYGIARLDLDEIAAELGVTPEKVRYWFGDQTEILISLLQTRQRWFIDRVQTQLAPLPTQREKMKELLEICARHFNATYWMELWKLALRDPRAREARQRLTDRYRDMIARVVTSGQRTGEFGDISPGHVGLVLSALIIGLNVEATLADDEAAVERMLHVMLVTAEHLLDVDLGSGSDAGATPAP
jgi:AcrR family transcriptional regulator